MPGHHNVRRTARATFKHPRRVPRLGVVLLVVTASVLVLLPAWLGALLGFPLD